MTVAKCGMLEYEDGPFYRGRGVAHEVINKVGALWRQLYIFGN